jgi:hypothetical protein
LDAHSNFAILQVLLHPSNNLLLISTPKSDTVWDIDAKAETTDLSYTSRAPFDWTNHPLNPDERILIGTAGASIWDWETCTVATSAEQLQLHSSAAAIEGDGVKNVVQSPFSHTVAVELSKPYGERDTTRMLVFEATNFCSGAGELIPVHEFQAIV